MNTNFSRISRLIVGLLVVAMVLVTFQATSAAPTAVAIMAYPGESIGSTRSLAKVYAEPDDASGILNVIPPEQVVTILGFNLSGGWIAVAKDDQHTLAGWLAASDVRFNMLVGTSRSVTRVYQQPNLSGDVAYVLSPEQKVQVLGHNADNTWLAIANPTVKQPSVFWVSTSSIKLPEVIGVARSLTKLYLKPDDSSKILTVIAPAQKVALIGRNNSGSWVAVWEIQAKRFIGWARASDLSSGSDRDQLPVLLVR